MLFIAFGTEFFLHVALKILAQGRREYESLESIFNPFFRFLFPVFLPQLGLTRIYRQGLARLLSENDREEENQETQ